MNGDERMHDDGDDYLWDHSGQVDPQVARLERLLGAYAHPETPRRQLVSSVAPSVTALHRGNRRHLRWRAAFAAAAVLMLCAIGTRTWYQQRLHWEAGRPWQVVSQQGEVRIDGRNAGPSATLDTTGILETGPATVARLRAAGIGEIALGEGSRLRLVETRSGRHRIELQQGRLWARVWAPPGQFGVGVPGADVIDMGCEFLLDIDAHGNGILTVRSGWVQVDNLRREVLVPQGTRVRLNGGGAAGSPHANDASQAFIAALEAIDGRDGMVNPAGAEVRALIAASRPQDAISLLSLLQAYPRLAEGPMFERMAHLLPGVPASRAAWEAGRIEQLNAWWAALPYPRLKRWWMQWPDALPSRSEKIAAWLHSPPGG